MEAFAKRENAFGGPYRKKGTRECTIFFFKSSLKEKGSFSGARRRREFRVREIVQKMNSLRRSDAGLV